MKLPTELAEPAIQLALIDHQLARQAEEREVVAMPPEGEDAAAARAEVLVDRSARAAAATFHGRHVTNRNRIGSHECQWRAPSRLTRRRNYRSRRIASRSGCGTRSPS